MDEKDECGVPKIENGKSIERVVTELEIDVHGHPRPKTYISIALWLNLGAQNSEEIEEIKEIKEDIKEIMELPDISHPGRFDQIKPFVLRQKSAILAVTNSIKVTTCSYCSRFNKFMKEYFNAFFIVCVFILFTLIVYTFILVYYKKNE